MIANGPSSRGPGRSRRRPLSGSTSTGYVSRTAPTGTSRSRAVPVREGDTVVEWVGTCADIEQRVAGGPAPGAARPRRRGHRGHHAPGGDARRAGPRDRAGAGRRVCHLPAPRVRWTARRTPRSSSTASPAPYGPASPSGRGDARRRLGSSSAIADAVRRRRPVHLLFPPGRPPEGVVPADTESWLIAAAANSIVLVPVIVDGTVAAVVSASVCGERPAISAADAALIGQMFDHGAHPPQQRHRVPAHAARGTRPPAQPAPRSPDRPGPPDRRPLPAEPRGRRGGRRLVRLLSPARRHRHPDHRRRGGSRPAGGRHHEPDTQHAQRAVHRPPGASRRDPETAGRRHRDPVRRGDRDLRPGTRREVGERPAAAELLRGRTSTASAGHPRRRRPLPRGGAQPPSRAALRSATRSAPSSRCRRAARCSSTPTASSSDRGRISTTAWSGCAATPRHSPASPWRRSATSCWPGWPSGARTTSP